MAFPWSDDVELEGTKHLVYAPGKEDELLRDMRANLEAIDAAISKERNYKTRRGMLEDAQHFYHPCHVFCYLQGFGLAVARENGDGEIDKDRRRGIKKLAKSIAARYNTEIYTPMVDKIKQESMNEPAWVRLKAKAVERFTETRIGLFYGKRIHPYIGEKVRPLRWTHAALFVATGAIAKTAYSVFR